MPTLTERRARVCSPYSFKRSPYSSHSLLLKWFNRPGEGLRVLDVGCGEGYLAEALAAQGYEVVCVDKPGCGPAALPEHVQFLELDLDEDVATLPGSFSFILCADLLEHLRDPCKVLLGLRSLLAAGGRLVASLPNSGNFYFRWNVLLGKFPAHDRGLFDRTHLHFYTWAGWTDLFSRSGFRIESVEPTGIPVGLALPRWDGTLPIRILERVFYTLARLWKTLFAYQFVVVARREAIE